MKISSEVLTALLDRIADRGVPQKPEKTSIFKPEHAEDPTAELKRASDHITLIMLAFAAQAFMRTYPGIPTKESEGLMARIDAARERGLIF